MKRVVYIAGAGHSGSTVLDTILGNAPGVESVGELIMLPGSAWVGSEDCSCGVRGDLCPFWVAVRGRFEAAGHGVADYIKHSELVQRRRRIGLPFFGRKQPTPWSPDVKPAQGFDRKVFAPWAEATTSLLGAILAESGADVLVDSSKSPERALALSRLAGVDLFLLHLVRDGRGMAWSLKKKAARSVAEGLAPKNHYRSVRRTAVAWSLVNQMVLRVAENLPPERRMILRYEDYTADLEGSLKPLVDFMGAGVLDVARRAAAGEKLELGHTIAGNRLRLGGPIRLKPDNEWRVNLAAPDRRRVEQLSKRLLKRFGYEV
jgi:hypothetical protein